MVDLRLDFFPLIFFQRGNVDLVVEVTNVANDGLILHLYHVVMGDDVIVAGGSNKNVGLVGSEFHGHHAVAFHRGLQRADRIDFGHPNLSRQRAHGLS